MSCTSWKIDLSQLVGLLFLKYLLCSLSPNRNPTLWTTHYRSIPQKSDYLCLEEEIVQYQRTSAEMKSSWDQCALLANMISARKLLDPRYTIHTKLLILSTCWLDSACARCFTQYSHIHFQSAKELCFLRYLKGRVLWLELGLQNTVEPHFHKVH